MRSDARDAHPRGTARHPLARTWAGYGPGAAGRTVASGARGVLLSRIEGEDGDARFAVTIVFEAGREATPLLIAADDVDIIARWRRYAEDLGLPLLIEDQSGRILAPWAQMGRVVLGPRRQRRRSAALAGRRPSFPLRRRAALRFASRG